MPPIQAFGLLLLIVALTGMTIYVHLSTPSDP